jgi:hypothetical protein
MQDRSPREHLSGKRGVHRIRAVIRVTDRHSCFNCWFVGKTGVSIGIVFDYYAARPD